MIPTNCVNVFCRIGNFIYYLQNNLAYVSDVWSARVVLGRVEEEPDPVNKLEPIEGTDPQVEEDPKDDGHRNLPQNCEQSCKDF